MTYSKNESIFIAMAFYGTGEVLTSHDGANWVRRPMPGLHFYGVAYGGENVYRYVAVGNDYIAASLCGEWWPL